MPEEFELKPITAEGVPAAIERAKHYRLLNQPAAAESICLDVLDVDPENQEALVVLILAMTDQFAATEAKPAKRAGEYLDRLEDEYSRNYYAGIVSERRARAFLERGPARVFAYDGLVEAMELFEKAAELRPPGNDDAILRWNSCVRTIVSEGLEPRHEEAEIGLE